MMSPLHQERSRPRFELLLDQLEFALTEAQAAGVFLEVRVDVGKEHLGWSLLDDSSADRAIEHIAGALRRKTHDRVELAPRLGPVFSEILESSIPQQPPELVHPAHQAPA